MTPSSAPQAIRLLACTDSGALTVTRLASASAASTTVPFGTTWLISPHFSRLSGADRLAGEQHLHSHLAGQLLCDAEHAAGSGDQPDLDLRQTELRAFLGHHQVTGEGQLGATTQRGAVDRGDRRLVDEVVDVTGEAPLTVVGVIQILAARNRLEICSGAEGFVTGTGDHHRPHVGVVLSLLERVTDADADGAVDAVACLRPVDRDDEDVAPALGEHRGVGHSSSTMVALAWPPPSHIVCKP